jgi:hypothetical protein
VIRLSSFRYIGPIVIAAAASLILAAPALAAPADGEVLPVKILHNLYNWCVDGAKWIIPMALIGGIIYHLCIPNRRDIPKAVMFLLVMALLIIPVALSAPGVINQLKSLGDSAWDSSTATPKTGGGGGKGTP